MALIAVLCPHCNSDQVIKGGQARRWETALPLSESSMFARSFVLKPAYVGRLPAVKQQIIDMALNGSGVRDTARVLGVSTSTVIKELKKFTTVHFFAFFMRPYIFKQNQPIT